MNLSELAQYVSDEEKAEHVLPKIGCLNDILYIHSAGRIISGESIDSSLSVIGVILEGVKTPLTKFLMAIKLFELDTSVRESAKNWGSHITPFYHL